MAEVGCRNLGIPLERTRSTAPSTTFAEWVLFFVPALLFYIVSIGLVLSLLVPLLVLLDPSYLFDLPLFVSNGLRFIWYSLCSLVLCIIFDGCATFMVGTPPRWSPLRILVTVLRGNRAFHTAELTAAKCWESIDLKLRPTEGWFRGLQLQNLDTILKIHFLGLFLLLFLEYYLSFVLPLFVCKGLQFLIFSVNWLLFSHRVLQRLIKNAGAYIGRAQPLPKTSRALFPHLSENGGRNREGKKKENNVILKERSKRNIPRRGNVKAKIFKSLTECLAKNMEFLAKNMEFLASSSANSKKNKGNNWEAKAYTRGRSGCWESMDLKHQPTLAIYPILNGNNSDYLKFVRGKNWEEKPLVEFNSTNNRAYHSGLLVSNSEKTNWREESKRQCMTERVLGSVDSTTRISSTDFDAADNSAHLVRPYQSGPAVSLSGNENKGEASKRECITNRILGSEDLQQNSGGRRDNAGKSFGAIYDPGIHTTHSLAQNSFEALENPPMLETLAIYPKLTGKISDLRKFVRGKNREEKPLVEFDSTNNSAYQSGLLVSNSENTNSREESKRPCMTERVLGSVNSTSKISLTDFDAADNSAHLVRAYRSGPVVSLSGNENWGEASKRECITNRILVLEDLQQNSGGRRDNAANSFGAIYDPGIHSTHSLAQNSFEVVEALPTRKQPNESVPLLSLGRLTLEGCVQVEKSQDLPRLMQIDGVEQRVTKSHRYLGGFTAQSTSSSRWPIGLPDGRHIVVLNLLEQSTKNVAHVAMADQCSPTVRLLEKKMVRRTLKRKYRIMSVIFAIHQQHFGKRCEGTGKSFRAMRICRNYGLNRVSTEKRIHKQHGINQWPFRQKWATRKGYSLGEKTPYEVSSLSMDMPRILKMDCSGGPDAQSAIGLPDGRYVLSLSKKRVVGKTLKRKCRAMSPFILEDHQQHAVRRWGDAAKSLGSKRICKQLGVQHASRVKCIHGQHVFHRWPFPQNWETMKAYSIRDKRPAEVLSLSTDGKLVSRLQLVHISWLVKFLPRPSAYRGGGEIVGPIALLSSEFVATNNRAHGIRKDQSGSSSASHSEEERPGEPKDVEGTSIRISLEELQNLFDRKREDAAKFLNVSVSTLKRICRQHGIKPWPYQARKKAIKKPPDRHRGMNTTGSSDDWRNLSASQEDPLLRGHVSGPIYGAISTCTDPAPGQPTPIVPHQTGNFLASKEEVLLWGHVSGPIYGTISSCTEPAPSQPMPIVPHPTEDLEDFADWSAVSALFDNSFPEGHASGSLDCTVAACSNPAPSQTMPTNATERQNMGFVELKATYGGKIIKFQLPPMFETSELKEKVSKILGCELHSFDVECKDGDGEWILMGCDENVREYLQLLNSLGKQVTKLKISDTNTTNLCETCGSLMRKRPRSVQM